MGDDAVLNWASEIETIKLRAAVSSAFTDTDNARMLVTDDG
jgi:hypothetical protein